MMGVPRLRTDATTPTTPAAPASFASTSCTWRGVLALKIHCNTIHSCRTGRCQLCSRREARPAVRWAVHIHLTDTMHRPKCVRLRPYAKADWPTHIRVAQANWPTCKGCRYQSHATTGTLTERHTLHRSRVPSGVNSLSVRTTSTSAPASANGQGGGGRVRGVSRESC